MTKRLRILLSVFFLLYFGFGGYLFVYQNTFLYPADKTAFDNCPTLEKAEKIKSGNLRAYFIKRSKEKVVVYYHGNAGRACDRYYMEQYFEPLGYSVLYVEYPGYAEEGETTIDSILNEVTIVNSFLIKQSFKEIYVVGESVGTGPAAYQASLPDSNLKKLILITPYNNIASVAFFHYPYYPMNILVKNNFTPDIWLKNASIPVVLILAENDEVVGFKQGMKLADVIPESNKTVHVVEGAGHNSIYDMQGFSSFFTNVIAK